MFVVPFIIKKPTKFIKMKRKLLSLVALATVASSTAFAQLQDEKNVTITMDLQPILQLNMQTPNQIDFVFDNINEYYAGITRYAATILKISSTVNWDLYAVGTSNGNVGATFWDQHIVYGTGGTGSSNQIPLNALELRQGTPNANAGAAGGAFADYRTPFPPAGFPAGSNSIYVATANTPPSPLHKYIAGHKGTNGGVGDDGVAGGSYLTSLGLSSDYYYTIDYRLLPGLPAIFPMAFDNLGTNSLDLVTANGAGAYAQPGVYTMNVKYILLEDQ
jgi:hypothetical protein